MASRKIDSQHRYHDTSAAYVLPKASDIIERDRLDAQAAAIVEMIGGFPFLALLRTSDNISKVVDLTKLNSCCSFTDFTILGVGCGTGVATIQIATALPSATIYGLDLTPVPESSRDLAPGNIIWVQGNALDMSYHQPSNDVMSREILTPAGLDYIFGQFASDDWEWHKSIVSGAERSGLSTSSGSDAALLMRNSGLEVISVETFEFSFVPSSKTPNSQAMGRYVQAKLIPQYPELLRKILGADGISGERLEALTKICLRDITSEEGLHQKYTVTIARKP
ncbi:hypothetical protein DID88_000488 [Monilinia fructigena]|uniref:Methyltransferase domain-containing protein n=1 Tax=Monilinia fructigena TaxID=38457 RepID=A0A395IN98_9HELO|nr:hypothetical protein DID88_000488 [Monilinia fructigena]